MQLDKTLFSSNLLFDPNVLCALFYLFLPIVVGIWSAGWTLEDLGLMHYRIPKENERVLFEIEPVHLKYNGLVKGYAGIASIIFLVITMGVYASIWWGSMLQVLLTLLLMVFYVAPAYFIYTKVAHKIFRKIFRKGLKQIEQPSEDDIVLK